MKQLVEAMKQMHGDQVDSQGAPYWLHPYRVARLTHKIHNELAFDNPELWKSVDRTILFQTALLHDVFEDTRFSAETVEEFGFNRKAVLNASSLNFNIPFFKDMSYDDKIKYLVYNGTPYSLITKLADNIDNSQHWRARIDTVNTKYYNSILMLQKAIGLEWLPDHILGDMKPPYQMPKR